jgi:glycine hydroxymethyltransferase
LHQRFCAGFFSSDLATSDPDISKWVRKETNRLQTQIELIASENVVSKAVLEAQVCIFVESEYERP